LIELEKIIPYTSANIALLENDTLNYLSFRGYEKYHVENFMKNFKPDKNFLYTLKTVIDTRKPLLIENTDEYPYWVFIPETQWIKSHLMIPIIYNNQLLGLISFDSDKPYSFSEATIKKVSSMLPLLGVALENAKLYDELKRELEERIANRRKIQKIFLPNCKTCIRYCRNERFLYCRASKKSGKNIGANWKNLRILSR